MALKKTSRYRIHDSILELLDPNGTVLARMEATRADVASSGTVSRNLLSAAPDAVNETISRPESDEVAKQIDETEKALDAMKRPLDVDQQKTEAQIRTFITHAREALKFDDVDGANVLSTKAHVLLLEVCKECRRSGQKSKLRPVSAR